MKNNPGKWIFISTLIVCVLTIILSILFSDKKHTTAGITPEQFGAVGKNMTFRQAGKDQAYIDSAYSGMPNITLDDNIDWAAINYIIQYKSAKSLIMKSDYYINKPIRIPKYQNRIMIDGNNFNIHMISNSERGLFTGQIPYPIKNLYQEPVVTRYNQLKII